MVDCLRAALAKVRVLLPGSTTGASRRPGAVEKDEPAVGSGSRFERRASREFVRVESNAAVRNLVDARLASWLFAGKSVGFVGRSGGSQLVASRARRVRVFARCQSSKVTRLDQQLDSSHMRRSLSSRRQLSRPPRPRSLVQLESRRRMTRGDVGTPSIRNSGDAASIAGS